MVRQFLKDGTEVDGVSWKTITATEFPVIYGIIERINERKMNNEIRTNKSSE